MKKKLNLPKFNSSEEESRYWEKLDLSEYFEKSDAKKVIFPNLKPTSRSISIRIPEMTLFRLKERANELNIPYQSLIKEYISKGVVGDSRNDGYLLSDKKNSTKK